jgi:hypothetical protein
MSAEKGWLRGQMKKAKQEVNDWHDWRRETIRTEIGSRLSRTQQQVAVRSVDTGRLVIKARKSS